MKIKLVADLIKNIPLLLDFDPEIILKFLIRAKEILYLKLVTGLEFMSVLVSRPSGRITQILGVYIGTTHNWGLVQAEIISTFLPPRVKEKFLTSHVLDHFQSASEDLTTYISSVVEAAAILGFQGSESQLVHRLLQNVHPRKKSHFLFVTKPVSKRSVFPRYNRS
jgi:hypothetical protein